MLCVFVCVGGGGDGYCVICLNYEVWGYRCSYMGGMSAGVVCLFPVRIMWQYSMVRSA